MEETDQVKILESDDPTKSLWCRLLQSLTGVLYLLGVVVLGKVLCLVINSGVVERHWMISNHFLHGLLIFSLLLQWRWLSLQA